VARNGSLKTSLKAKAGH